MGSLPKSRLTYKTMSGTSVSTSYIDACPVLVFGHASSRSQRFVRVQDVSAPFFRPVQSSGGAPFGVLVEAVPLIAALPSFAVMESLKPISAPITPVLVATVLTAGCWDKKWAGSKAVVIIKVLSQVWNGRGRCHHQLQNTFEGLDQSWLKKKTGQTVAALRKGRGSCLVNYLNLQKEEIWVMNH